MLTKENLSKSFNMRNQYSKLKGKKRKTIIHECQRIKIELSKVLHILHSTYSCGLDHLYFRTIIAKNNLHSLLQAVEKNKKYKQLML